MADETRLNEMKKIEEKIYRDFLEQDAVNQRKEVAREQRLDRSYDMMERLQLRLDRNAESTASPASGTGKQKLSHQVSLSSITVSKVDFPYFDGEDVNGWIFHCNHWFELDGTPNDRKVQLSSIHLEGTALLWHKRFMRDYRRRERITWPDYCHILTERFSKVHHEPSDELKNARQSGSVKVKPSVESALAMADEQMIVSFIQGLNDELQEYVRSRRPQSLVHAQALAKEHESYLKLWAGLEEELVAMEALDKTTKVVASGDSHDGEAVYEVGKMIIGDGLEHPIAKEAMTTNPVDEMPLALKGVLKEGDAAEVCKINGALKQAVCASVSVVHVGGDNNKTHLSLVAGAFDVPVPLARSYHESVRQEACCALWSFPWKDIYYEATAGAGGDKALVMSFSSALAAAIVFDRSYWRAQILVEYIMLRHSTIQRSGQG